MHTIRKLVLVIWSAICLLSIYVWPTNKYEWMLMDGLQKDELPVDDRAGFYPVFAILPTFVLIIYQVVSMLRKRTSGKSAIVPCLIISICLIVWAFKFLHVLRGG